MLWTSLIEDPPRSATGSMCWIRMADAREITMAEQMMTWGWMHWLQNINIDLIHPETVKWDMNEDGKLATVKLRRDAG